MVDDLIIIHWESSRLFGKQFVGRGVDNTMYVYHLVKASLRQAKLTPKVKKIN